VQIPQEDPWAAALLCKKFYLKGQKLSCAGRRKSQKTIKMALLGPATDLKGQKLSCAGRRKSQKTIKMALLDQLLT
jgi:hypothetical protein